MAKLSLVSSRSHVQVQRVEERGEESIRLKRLGICENRPLQVMNAGDPMILEVAGARVAISRQVAQFVEVDDVTNGAVISCSVGSA